MRWLGLVVAVWLRATASAAADDAARLSLGEDAPAPAESEPACVVPELRGRKPATARRRQRATGCRAGKVVHRGDGREVRSGRWRVSTSREDRT